MTNEELRDEFFLRPTDRLDHTQRFRVGDVEAVCARADALAEALKNVCHIVREVEDRGVIARALTDAEAVLDEALGEGWRKRKKEAGRGD